jgi:hypothetical protein
MKEVYLHKHEPGKLQFTLCGLLVEDGTLNIGVAIKSPKDHNFVKATGRKIARARAKGKPYDVWDNFTELHPEDQADKITFYLSGIASRIMNNPSAIREITQLYHPNAGLKKGQARAKYRLQMET